MLHIRKVEPLRRALKGKKGWITGLRREHSAGRAALPQREFDDGYLLLKFNPLADWTEGEVWEYLRTRSVPITICMTKATGPSAVPHARGRW
jgi:phosphoadenosine phosphosulfate reductase